MKRYLMATATLFALIFTACSDDDNTTEATCSDGIQNGDETGVDCGGSCDPCTSGIVAPETYVFEREGASSVAFPGQTIRLLMADEIISKLKDNTATEEEIDAMYAHAQDAMDFEDAALNASGNNVRSKTAASFDYFSDDPVTQGEVRADFDGYIAEQVNDVFPNWNTVATAGNAGQLTDGSSTRYVNGKGLELDQAFTKGLIGAFVADQILNNYTSPNLLAQFEEANDNGVVVEGQNYTDLEHDWDEAFGYAFGVSDDLENPISDQALGSNDNFLAKYIQRVEGDPSFTGIAQEIFDAFKLGRAAIVEKDYDLRDQQADILREAIAEVIAIRAVYYLQAGKGVLDGDTPDYGGGFHDLSEGFGFVYSLQFTRRPSAEDGYFTRAEVMGYLDDIYGSFTNGFWDVTPEALDAVSEAIAEKFDFTVADAADTSN